MYKRIALPALIATVLAGCPQKAKTPEPPAPAPKILSFKASAARVPAGGDVTLSWSTENATRIELVDAEQGVVSGVDASKTSGEVKVTVESDRLFVLTARNERGVRETAAVVVQVDAPSKDVLFIASPTELSAGEKAVLAWSAAGAKAVSLATSEGAAVDLEGQVQSGTVQVSPAASTTYLLTVDGTEHKAEIQVRASVDAFVAAPTPVLPGQTLTLSWKTSGAAKVVVEGAGAGSLYEETDAAKVADGSWSYDVAETVDPASVLSFTLRAETADGTETLQPISVYVGGAPQVTAFTAPTYALLGGTYQLTWKTTGADVVEVLLDGTVIHRTATGALAANGTLTLSTPAKDATLKVRALDSRGAFSDSAEKVVSPVGVPTVTSFTSTPAGGITNGGDVVTLDWVAPEARHVTIVDQAGRVMTVVNGAAAAQGTVDVYPNVDSVYTLTADNTLGDEATATVNVTVTTPATLVFSPSLAPAGATVNITGTTVTGGGALRFQDYVLKNFPGDAFIDISATGTPVPVTSGADTVGYLVTFPEAFHTTLFDVPIDSTTASININGWLAFTDKAASGPSVPSTTLPTTSLEPLSICPYLDDLQAQATTQIFWQLDGTGNQQRLIVQWSDIKPYGSSSNGKSLTFQAQIHADGTVVFAYQSIVGLTTSDLQAIGVMNADETGALAVTNDQYTDGLHVEAGDTFRLFGEVMPPVPVVARTQPYVVRQTVGNGWIELSGAPGVLPLDQFAVSEVSAFPPSTVTDGQWFEVENKTAQPIDLSGWTLDIGGTPVTVTTGTTLPASGRLVFGQSTGAGDGVTVDYVYGTQAVIPAGGTVGVSLAGSTYTQLALPPASFPEGASWQSGPLATGMTAATGVTSLECLAAAASTYGTHGQKGTPGAANTACPNYAYSGAIPANFESIAATGTAVTFADLDDDIATITLPVPVKVDGVSFSSIVVSTNGYISLLPMMCDAYCWSTNKVVPDPAPADSWLPPYGFIAPFWDDNQLTLHGGVYWERKTGYTIVSWEDVYHYGEDTDSLNFQVKFFDTGDVEFHFGTMTGEDGSTSTTWFEHPSGKAAFVVNVESATNPGIASNTAFRLAAQ